MAYFRTCPECGAHLDPGEKCDCKEPKEEEKPPAQFLTVSDVAARWSVSVDLVYDIIKRGELQAIKIGGSAWRIHRSAVTGYEASLMAKTAEPKRRTRTTRKPVLRL